MKRKQHLSAVCMAALLTLGAAKSNAQLLQQLLQQKGATGEFVPNKGQITDASGQLRPDILYSANSNQGTLFITANAISYVQIKSNDPLGKLSTPNSTMSLSRTDLTFLNTNSAMQIAAQNVNPGVLNYFIGGRSITGVKGYQQITYNNIYNNIDLVLATVNGSPAYQFILRTGANPGDIKFTFSTNVSASISSNGITATTPLGNITLPSPIAQPGTGTGTGTGGIGTMPAVFVQTGAVFGINIKKGGILQGIIDRVDGVLNVIVAQNANGGPFATLTQQWTSFYGGSSQDVIYDMVVDNNGNQYATGNTASTNGGTGAFPVSFGFKNNQQVPSAAFVLGFDNLNRRVFANVICGSGGHPFDAGMGVAFSNDGGVYMTGISSRNNDTLFPVLAVPAYSNAYQQLSGPKSHNPIQTDYNTFIARFQAINGSLEWSTYFNGIAGSTQGRSICTDKQGNVYLGGFVDSLATGFPTMSNSNFQQTTYLGGWRDGFIAKFNGATLQQEMTVYVGSAGQDAVESITCDKYNNLFVKGTNQQEKGSTWTLAGGANAYKHQNVSTPNTPPLFNPSDMFVMRFQPDGTLTWSTCFGTKGNEFAAYASTSAAHTIATDSLGNVYTTGLSDAVGLPLLQETPNSYQQAYHGVTIDGDAFIAKFSNTGQQMWTTYYGGTKQDRATSICVDPITNDVFVTGQTNSTDFPLHGSYLFNQSNLNNTNNNGSFPNSDGFILGFTTTGAIDWATYFGGSADEYGEAVSVYNNYIGIAGYSQSTTTNFPLKQSGPGSYWQPNYGGAEDGYIGIIKRIPINVTPNRKGAFDNEEVKTINSGSLQATIYPNPAKGQLTISLKNAAEKNMQVELYNILGQKIYSAVWNTGKDEVEANKQIDLSKYSQGVYVLKLNAGNDSFNQQIVVQ